MPTKKLIALRRPDHSQDAHGLLDAERDTLASATHLPEAPPLDAEPAADLFHLTRARSRVPSDGLGVDPGRPRTAVFHNAFWIPGKVPSLNELLDAKSKKQPILRSIIMRQKPQKGKQRGARFDVYNEIKQDWKQRTIRALGEPFVRVQSAYFGYLIVEETLKRDPSNICSAAVKFIEDGLVAAGAIPNDGWNEVLGIGVHWIHRKGRDPGVYVTMTDRELSKRRLVVEYEDHFLTFI